MNTVAELAAKIAQLDPARREELDHLLTAGQAVALPATPGIVRTPDVCGGAARIIRTRIPVWTLERMRQLGLSEAEILRSYPSLRAVDLVQAWAYVEQHRDQIEREIKENQWLDMDKRDARPTPCPAAP